MKAKATIELLTAGKKIEDIKNALASLIAINYEILIIGESKETAWGFLTKVVMTKDTDNLKLTIHKNSN